MQFDADQIRRDNALDAVASRFGVRLTKDGKEWKGCCPFHAEKTASFTIFPAKSGLQRFQCFGCGEGGDVIDFVREWEGAGFAEACEVLGGSRQAIAAARPTTVVAAEPVYLPPPPGITILPLHPVEVWNPKRGRAVTYRPKAVYAYPGVGYVLRIELDEGRKFTPVVLWDGQRWTHGSMPQPRPLYGLAGLAERPSAQVLVVEGEKCRDAAALALPGLVVVSWCGGGKAAGKSDWSPLAGRSVLVWPDLDDAGIATGQAVAGLAVAAGAAVVKVLDLDGLDKPKGWDVADAVQKDWMDRDDLMQFMRSRVKVWEKKEVDDVGLERLEDRGRTTRRDMRGEAKACADGVGNIAPPLRNGHASHSAPPKSGAIRDNITSIRPDIPLPPTDDLDAYRENLLTNEEGKLKPKMASNFYWMLRGHPETRGLFAFNDVAQGVFLMRPPPWEDAATWIPRALSDADISKAAMWLEARQLSPKKSETRDSIKTVATHARFNPIRDYLQALRWDGIPRLAGGMWEGETQPHGAAEYLGAPADEIFGTFLTKWHISAVARIMRPGCKADCMLVIEGAQGKMKSTYLRMMATIKGHEYFADGIGDIANKDSIMLMAGCWIVENAEMDGFSRQDLRTIKAWLSRTTDRYIPKFESEPREVPRTFVVSGTHNPSGHGYLKDPTGNRRFWPLPVSSIDLPRVTADKDQIWAEAVARFTAGEIWWLSQDEESQCDRLTQDRRSVDPWGYKIDPLIGLSRVVRLDEVLDRLAIPSAQQNELTVKRVGDYLRGRGFRQDGPDKWERDLG